MKQLQLISGGAAQGLVAAVGDSFAAKHGFELAGTFGAVGLMKDKLLGGAPCDVVILTAALIEGLELEGHVDPGSARSLGVVRTGVAVRTGAAVPDIATPEALATVLCKAKGIYFPDPVKATAGMHFMKVLKLLDLDQELADRLRPFPNGATAMREMAAATGQQALVGLPACFPALLSSQPSTPLRSAAEPPTRLRRTRWLSCWLPMPAPPNAWLAALKIDNRKRLKPTAP